MKTANNSQNIPFNEAQQAWLGGFFAGMHSHILQSAGSGDAANARAITILYGSQTGNSESVAHDAAQVAKAHGLNPSILGMDEIEADSFTKLEYLLIITSTYGEGEMPDNAQLLWDTISSDDSIELANMKYSVLALGDTSYDLYCQAGIEWDQRLEKLGAKRLYERVDCDVDFDDAAESWISNIIPLMADGATAITIDSTSTSSAAKYGRKNPFPGKLVANRLLSSPDSSKEICHYEISIAGSELSYEAGDALNVVPVNCPELVTDIIQAIGCRGDEDEPVSGVLMPLTQALAEHFEIKLPSKDLLDEIARRSGGQELNNSLSSGDKDKLSSYLWGRDTLDLLLQFPEMQFSAAEFLALLKPLQHRAYSISSSGKAHPETVHLTISSVRYNSHNREHKGVCSTYLADLADDKTAVRCFFSPSKVFRVPEDNDLPMIMVGPGTGIAPFRAFLQEREFRNAKGINWLFFGDRNATTDFIYQDEIEAMQKSKVLSKLDLAFSRDQEEKIYVQDRMREKGEELFSLLEQGGYFFVCGDALRMAKDVDKALHDVIAKHGKLSEEQATEYVNQMKKDKRYVRDVY
ncbi:sulfite reductase subunit alpha [Methylococcaceae bacterium HT1]|nr:sulfite reductase subunit alpha [Methylococcaceae bacterium HT1]TXL15905.1 sulfite reductase subunit alpha [Methylococcaceae bacterium HT3]TXL21929.1 sulfite reductase subunit alpha [Methylococcaceae bacterium HT2]